VFNLACDRLAQSASTLGLASSRILFEKRLRWAIGCVARCWFRPRSSISYADISLR